MQGGCCCFGGRSSDDMTGPRVWVRLFLADLEFKQKLWSLYNPQTGYTESLDDSSEIVVPEDDYGLYAIDILDPSITYPTSDEANSGPGDIDSSCRTPEALDLDLSRFNSNSTSFDWPHLTLNMQLLRVDLTLTGFPVTRRTSYKLHRYSLGLRHAFPLPRCSLDLRQASPSPVGPSMDASTKAFTIIDGDERCRRLLQTLSATSSEPPSIADQMAFAGSCGLSLANYSLSWVPYFSITHQVLLPSRAPMRRLFLQLKWASRLIPLFESPHVQVPPASDPQAPLKVYTRRAPPSFVKVVHLTEVYLFHDMIDMLIGCGYKKGTTLFGYGYDFRQSIRIDKLINGLKEKLEIAYKASGGRKVNIISHSMGGLLVMCFMSLHNDVRKIFSL
ncbi:lecithin:cholesterol acyltransferase 3 [Actinidia rufa]|uniref:Lecithin:cholesterol acyltransferase 3 n=1 Tax=Actinidia rufa TaxID=165716 RepID=A0A7J0GKU9_9ERIC|nr:lecithin:cholesterol acyltransferase 3 [Actinidia rufa]